MLTNDEMKQIQDQMALIFVTRQDCDKRNDEVERRLMQGEVHFAKIDEKLKMIIWILAAVGSGIIAMLLKMIFGM